MICTPYSLLVEYIQVVAVQRAGSTHGGLLGSAALGIRKLRYGLKPVFLTVLYFAAL
jgi:hypothetical protein